MDDMDIAEIDSTYSEFINSALSSISKNATLCKHYFDDNKLLTVALEQLQDCVKDYCVQDITLSAYKTALNKTENEYKDAENAPDIPFKDSLQKWNAKTLPNITEQTISQHPYMVQYLRDIEEVELDKEVETEDGIIAPEDFTPPLDPITKTAIRNPVRNTQCGHVYEKDSIAELIKKKNTRCPYIGCPAFQYIQPTYLQPDRKLKKKIDLFFLNN